MSQPNDCTHCAEWEICPFHPKPAEPPVGLVEPCESDAWGDPEDPNNPFVLCACLRLLGPDDPEVSSDLIYLDEATGHLVAVPQGAEQPSKPTSVTIGGLPIPYDERLHANVHPPCPEMPGRFAITLLRGSEREVKLNVMFLADRMCDLPAFVAIDAPALRTDHAWFEARNVGTLAVTYVLRFVP